MTGRRAHWDAVYQDRDPTSVSWYQQNPARSLILIEETRLDSSEPIIDIGGGASRLVDRLLELGYTDVTVLDVAAAALRNARERLGEHAGDVAWIEGDVLEHPFDRRYAVWHDRATFHFLTDSDEQAAYGHQVSAAVVLGGHAIIAGFSPDGPETCSGLPVHRHDADSLTACLGSDFEPVVFHEEAHRTPSGERQHFLYGRFRRVAG